MEERRNIVLIGMPASGKSTVGVILAKVLGMDFLDTDLLIQQRENALLCNLIKEYGVDGFLRKEEAALMSVSCKNTVIATGGSAVYSKNGMEHLKKTGDVFYLEVEKQELFTRLHNIKERGVVLRDGESLEDMYRSRIPLYESFADYIIDETNASIEETVSMIIQGY